MLIFGVFCGLVTFCDSLVNARDCEGTEFSHDTKNKIELFSKDSHQFCICITKTNTYTFAIDMISRFTPRVSPQRFCVSLRECHTRAPKNNYALTADIDSKLTPRESSAILYLSSRVPRTSTEEQLRTRNWHQLKIHTS